MSRKKLPWEFIATVLTIVTVISAVAFVPRMAAAAQSPVTTNVQVNQVVAGPFPINKQNEPSLAQNPTNSLNLVAGSKDEIGEPACTNTTPSSCPFVAGVSVSGFYASFDGGKTWPCQGLMAWLPAFQLTWQQRTEADLWESCSCPCTLPRIFRLSIQPA